MKFRHFIIALVAAVICSAACRETEPDLSFLVNMAWTATSDADWVDIDPAAGEGADEAQTVTVLDNSSWNRVAKVTIDIVYDTQTFPVGQVYRRPEPYQEHRSDL